MQKETVKVISAFLLALTPIVNAAESFCPGASNPNPNVIFCDSFETPGVNENEPSRASYFSFDDANGDFNRVSNESIDGSHALQYIWKKAGDVDAGYFQLNFGINPLGSNIASTEHFREIYWRLYVKMPQNFVGFPSKLTRARGFAGSNGADSMIAHIWAEEGTPYLKIDPASGIRNNQVVTTKWNDQANLTWLGARATSNPFPKGEWVCVEGHVKLNDAGQANGVFGLYINDQLAVSRNDLDWVGSWGTYGINAILFSNYWNSGAAADNQVRYLDAIVVSKQKIGCIGSSNAMLRPSPPTNLTVTQ